MLHWQLAEEDFAVNVKKLRRLYREEGLRIRRRRRKHVASASREKLEEPTFDNERWSMDFVSDELEDCRVPPSGPPSPFSRATSNRSSAYLV